MAHTYCNLLFHAIFSTKDRAATISPEIRDDLLSYIAGIVCHMGGKTLIAGGTADHVHLLLELPSHVAVSDTLRVVKTNSSRWAHERWPERRLFGWQTGYAAFTVSKSNVNAVRAYSANQEEHHKKVDFRDEFRAFLRKNGITYDDRYIWDCPSLAPPALTLQSGCLPTAYAVGYILTPLRGSKLRPNFCHENLFRT